MRGVKLEEVLKKEKELNRILIEFVQGRARIIEDKTRIYENMKEDMAMSGLPHKDSILA